MASSNSNLNSMNLNPNFTNSIDANSYNDLYYLHSSDGPGLALVSQTLTGDNYATWSRSMRIAFVESVPVEEQKRLNMP